MSARAPRSIPWPAVAQGVVASTLAVALGTLSAAPIYETPWVWVTALAAVLVGATAAVLPFRRGWGVPASLGALALAWVVCAVPATMPDALTTLGSPNIRGVGATFRELGGSMVLSWKQLLTVSIPVGTYETLLVPLSLVGTLTVWMVTSLTLRAGNRAVWGAVPLLLPVLFGTLWGSAELSAPVHTPIGSMTGPREISVWCGSALLAGIWVARISGAPRREALAQARLTPTAAERATRARLLGVSVGILTVSLVAGAVTAPLIAPNFRAVPRTGITVEQVLHERTSPLTGYRTWKQNDRYAEPLFSVASAGPLPERIRMAVLDTYDGVEFRVGTEAAAQFTRVPSAPEVPQPSQVEIQILSGYHEVWAPLGQIGSTPQFTGERAETLAGAFYAHRESGTAIVVPGGTNSAGLREGDGYRVTLSAAPTVGVSGDPGHTVPQHDLSATPELASWLSNQGQPANAAGLTELVQRLRDRGYLSHAREAKAGETDWLDELTAAGGGGFVPSVGGHSIDRIEDLFSLLNEQELAAGAHPTPELLVAAPGDDEQFATAAALIATALGYEARVVYGVRLGDPATTLIPEIPSCTHTCTGANLTAWLEVLDATGTWGTLDVTPQSAHAPALVTNGTQTPQHSTETQQRNAHEVEAPLNTRESAPPTPDAEKSATSIPWLWPTMLRIGTVGLAVLLLVLPVTCIVVTKRWRTRWRKRQTDPELAALAAWDELLDYTRDTGTPISVHTNRSDAETQVDSPEVRWIRSEVDRAVWSSQGISPAAAKNVWAAVDRAIAEQRSRGSRWVRVRTACSLRSLIAWLELPPRSRNTDGGEFRDR